MTVEIEMGQKKQKQQQLFIERLKKQKGEKRKERVKTLEESAHYKKLSNEILLETLYSVLPSKMRLYLQTLSYRWKNTRVFLKTSFLRIIDSVDCRTVLNSGSNRAWMDISIHAC